MNQSKFAKSSSEYEPMMRSSIDR